MKTTLGEIEQHLQAFFPALHDKTDGGTLTFVSDLRGIPRPNKETRVRFLLWEIARPAVTYPPPSLLPFFSVLPYVLRVGDGGVCIDGGVWEMLLPWLTLILAHVKREE